MTGSCRHKNYFFLADYNFIFTKPFMLLYVLYILFNLLSSSRNTQYNNNKVCIVSTATCFDVFTLSSGSFFLIYAKITISVNNNPLVNF